MFVLSMFVASVSTKQNNLLKSDFNLYPQKKFVMLNSDISQNKLFVGVFVVADLARSPSGVLPVSRVKPV